MIFYKSTVKEVWEFDKFFCDKCKKEIIGEVELQETQNIDFVGGYASVFGDGKEIECNLCQHCLLELIGGFCRTKGNN